jgi:hypothetical protein
MAKAKESQTKGSKQVKSQVKSQVKGAKNPILGDDAAKLLGCSMALIYQMRRDGRLKSGFVKSKRLYVEKDEIEKLKASGEIHPRKQKQKMGPGDLVSVYQKEVSFEVTCSSLAYNMLSMMLSSQKINVAQWCTMMVQNTTIEAQQSMTKTAAVGGSKR